MFFDFFNKSANFFQISSGDRDKFCTNIIETSAPRGDFYFLVVLSALIVSFGIMTDNIVLLIGGMMVTPLLSPIMAIALGIAILEPKVIFRSVWVFFTASLMAATVSAIVGMISEAELGSIKVISNMKPDIIVFVIAATAGIAASYTWAKPNLNSTLPGIAITVTLIPPLTVFGFSIAKGDLFFLSNSFFSFLLNICGIILSSIVVFFFLGFYSTKRKVMAEVKQEEK